MQKRRPAAEETPRRRRDAPPGRLYPDAGGSSLRAGFEPEKLVWRECQFLIGVVRLPGDEVREAIPWPVNPQSVGCDTLWFLAEIREDQQPLPAVLSHVPQCVWTAAVDQFDPAASQTRRRLAQCNQVLQRSKDPAFDRLEVVATCSA